MNVDFLAPSVGDIPASDLQVLLAHNWLFLVIVEHKSAPVPSHHPWYSQISQDKNYNISNEQYKLTWIVQVYKRSSCCWMCKHEFMSTRFLLNHHMSTILLCKASKTELNNTWLCTGIRISIKHRKTLLQEREWRTVSTIYLMYVWFHLMQQLIALQYHLAVSQVLKDYINIRKTKCLQENLPVWSNAGEHPWIHSQLLRIQIFSLLLC